MNQDVPQMVFVHKTAAVYGTVDALDASVGGELPHDEPDVVRQSGISSAYRAIMYL